MNILFVCTGNTCRSPMAEALLRHKNQYHTVRSAGVFADGNASVNEYAYQALQEKGIKINHQSQEVSEELIEWAGLVLTMTASHQQMLTAQYPAHKQKIQLLKGYASDKVQLRGIEEDSNNITDPFGKNLAAYKDTLAELDVYIDRLLQVIDTEE